jgi:hypothetical protein
MQVVVAWILISVFQVAHVVEEVDFHEPKDEAGGKIERDWAKAQVASTVDFAPGSSFWLHLTGGLSCQVGMLKVRLSFGGQLSLLMFRKPSFQGE